MKNKTAKAISVIISAMVLTTTVFCVNSFSVKSKETQEMLDITENTSKEIPQEFLNTLSSSVKEKINLLSEEYTILNVGYETKYWPYNSIEDADLTIESISVDIINKETDEYAGKIICVYWKWLDNKPIIREKDFVSVKWDSDDFTYEPDSFYAEDYWRNEESQEWEVEDSYNTLSSLEQGLIGHWCSLAKNKNHIAGAMVFKLNSASPQKAKEDIDWLQIDYSHHNENFYLMVSVLIFSGIVIAVPAVIRKIKKRRLL